MTEWRESLSYLLNKLVKSMNRHIVTSSKEDRCWKYCLCCICGTVEMCTPSFDYYTTKDHGEALVCENCFREIVRKALR